LIGGHVNEFSGGIDEMLDEPWAGDAIDFNFFTRYPFHKGVIKPVEVPAIRQRLIYYNPFI
jgi:hypothetical protein